MPDYKRIFQTIVDITSRSNNGAFDEFVRSQLAAYICVLASGALERACQSIFSDYASRSSPQRLARHINSRLSKFQNPNPQKIRELIASFDKQWADELDEFWEGEIKDSIGSIVGNRHNISHGRTSTVSLAQVGPWVKNAERLCRKLEEFCQ